MAWFKREKKRIDQPTPPDERRVKTEGLWTKCENCRTTVWKKDLEANWRVCPKCEHHFRLNATQRLELLLDSRWVEHDAMEIWRNVERIDDHVWRVVEPDDTPSRAGMALVRATPRP